MPTRRSPRKKPAQSRSKETVRALLTAAARILEQDGYERASVNRIAKLAGVSIGSLYQYFPTKEALVAAVAQELSERMIAVFSEGLQDAALLPLPDAVRAVAARSVRAFRLAPRLRAVIVSELPETLLGSHEFDLWLAEALEAYFEFHRDRVRPRNVKLAVALLMASVEASAKAASLRGDPEQEVVDELSHLIFGYITK